ncbi:hypothetical protein N7517_001101 [Penicillium concentricum]|uniref:Uncharacterized protein n=1 Tax=Penicillium concentricum TaxID=293559 RepID=A0A9W9SS87_9EURO|nr:uncharacterized protein N7517_001101 [Penicillium concentricum]KAJ5383190.1 hypothetical protein N7517_001101 [Penicillium concentricum]
MQESAASVHKVSIPSVSAKPARINWETGIECLIRAWFSSCSSLNFSVLRLRLSIGLHIRGRDLHSSLPIVDYSRLKDRGNFPGFIGTSHNLPDFIPLLSVSRIVTFSHLLFFIARFGNL